MSAQDEFEYEIWFTSGPQLQAPQLYGRNRTRRWRDPFTVQEEWTQCKMDPIPSIVPFGSLKMKLIGSLACNRYLRLGDVVNNSHPPVAIGFSYPGEAEGMYIMRQMFCTRHRQ